jgi:hypothetical protein
MKRKRFPKIVETKVLVESRRRCALCFGLDGDTAEKEGQLAHVDRNSSNQTMENAAFLCTTHHARYDSQSMQTKRHTADELKAYRRMLYEYLQSQSRAWPDTLAPSRNLRRGKVGVSVEVYERRVTHYRATREFVRSVVAEGKVEFVQIFKFAADTDEALFLFDETIAQYLSLIYKRAIRFRTIGKLLQLPDQDVGALAAEDAEVLDWFSKQFEEMRMRFVPFLRLA